MPDTPATEDFFDTEALGRSRGRLGTKIVGLYDAAGRLVDFVLTGGQAHELPRWRCYAGEGAPDQTIADMACDACEFRAPARVMGTISVVPSRRTAKVSEPCPSYIQRRRNLIERCWARLKDFRAVATRHEKTAASYAAGVAIAASLDWIKSMI